MCTSNSIEDNPIRDIVMDAFGSCLQIGPERGLPMLKKSFLLNIWCTNDSARLAASSKQLTSTIDKFWGEENTF